MKNLLLLLGLVYVQLTIAQKPEIINPLNLQWHDESYYALQAKLWGEFVKSHPKDAPAWKNYYFATRYANRMYIPKQGEDKEKLVKEIVAGMEKNVPNSAEYCSCKLSLDGNSNSDTVSYLKLIKKGLSLDPNEVGILESYINYCEINGQTGKLKELYTRLYNTNNYCQGIMESAYNILMSLDKNAIVFACGDDDTYPLRMLQEVNGIRTDITVINIYFSKDLPIYTKRILKEKNITLSDDLLNKGKDIKDEMDFMKQLVLAINQSNPNVPVFFDIFCEAEKTFPDSLYCTGMAWKFSTTRIDNFSRLKNNIENHFHLDYLDDGFYHNDGIATGVVEEMKSEYVLPFALLYKYYLEMGESNDRTEYYKTYVMKYAAKTGKEKEMEDFLQGKRNSL
jgi:hypothetical protein